MMSAVKAVDDDDNWIPPSSREDDVDQEEEGEEEEEDVDDDDDETRYDLAYAQVIYCINQMPSSNLSPSLSSWSLVMTMTTLFSTLLLPR